MFGKTRAVRRVRADELRYGDVLMEELREIHGFDYTSRRYLREEGIVSYIKRSPQGGICVAWRSIRGADWMATVPSWTEVAVIR